MASYLPPWIASYLPHEFLPWWLLSTSIVATFNSLQTYYTQEYTARVYSTPAAVNALSARTFGTWTFLAAVVRFYASYHISDPVVYKLALISYVIAFGHFYSEWLVFRSTRWGKPLAGPIIVSTASLVWMYWQWGYYVL